MNELSLVSGLPDVGLMGLNGVIRAFRLYPIRSSASLLSLAALPVVGWMLRRTRGRRRSHTRSADSSQDTDRSDGADSRPVYGPPPQSVQDYIRCLVRRLLTLLLPLLSLFKPLITRLASLR